MIKVNGPKKITKSDKLGLTHVYTGKGKGKTTTSLGIALRAVGHGYKVLMIQFMKGASYLGELEVTKKLPNLEILQFGEDCPWTKDIKKGVLKCGGCRFCFSLHNEDKKRSDKALDFAKLAAESGKYDILILDEINGALYRNLIDSKEIIKLIDLKHPDTELILTGRNAPKEIIKRADLVTEMLEIKHPMSKGIEGRRGIDY